MAAPCTQPRAGQKSAPNTSSPNPSGARRAIFRPGRGANERPCGPFLPCLRERGGRGRRSGGDFAKKRNGPHRPPRARPARELGQGGREVSEEREQKAGGKLRQVLRGPGAAAPGRGCRGAGAPLQVFWGEAKEPETPSRKPHKGNKPTKETTPQPTNLRKKRGKAAASLCAVERIISRW